MLLDLLGPLFTAFREELLDHTTAGYLGQQIAESGTECRTETDERQGHRKVEQETTEDGQEEGSGNGERLQAGKRGTGLVGDNDKF